MNNKIIKLMQVPEPVRDVSWLLESLQAAVELELSTLPPYLCGAWSVIDTTSDVYGIVLGVALEEMGHMGLACNMLTTIGGTPQISTSIPAYPGPLPGGVSPDLTVYLAGLSIEYIQNVYMKIEYPEGGPVALAETAEGETYPTIGAFYDAILCAFQQQPASIFTGANQQTIAFDGNANNNVFPITSLADAEKAISQIKEQGEGTSQSPEAVDFGDELAHYYKYKEIVEGNYLVNVNGTWQYTGGAIPFPACYDMTPIPAGGYQNPSAEVAAALQAFNAAFKTVLVGLESAWSGDPKAIGDAINAMFALPSLATAIMQFPIPGGNGSVYGPNFVLD
jgi:hypothetical protein